jgi:long-subunit fatty acid transport protein
MSLVLKYKVLLCPLLTPLRSGKMLLVLSLTITPAWAGGLYVREFGQPNQAASGAGGNVLAEDASTAFQNPSGLFNLENDSN